MKTYRMELIDTHWEGVLDAGTNPDEKEAWRLLREYRRRYCAIQHIPEDSERIIIRVRPIIQRRA